MTIDQGARAKGSGFPSRDGICFSFNYADFPSFYPYSEPVCDYEKVRDV